MRTVPQEPTAFALQGRLEEEILRVKPKSITGVLRLAVIRAKIKRRQKSTGGETDAAKQSAAS